MALRTISLFTGGAGLDTGLRIARPDARTVCYVESGIENCEVLAARIEEGSLEPAPIWSNVKTFDGRPWRGAVDCIVGGFPCQDISVAGRGEGIVEGNRSGLWYEFARIIREVRPRIVFVENVGALLIRGLDAVLGELAESGYDAEWSVLRASAVGAPHRRERVFILAYRRCECNERRGESRILRGAEAEAQSQRHKRKWGWNPSCDCGASMAYPAQRGFGIGGESSGGDGFADGGHGAMENPARHGRQGCDGEGGRIGRRGVCETGESVADAEREGREEPIGAGQPQNATETGSGLDNRLERRSRPPADSRGRLPRGEQYPFLGVTQSSGIQGERPGGEQEPPAPAGPRLPRCPERIFPPGPGALEEWRDILAESPWLAPAISAEEAKSHLCGVADGLAALVADERTDALRMLGNGVVPLQAAACFIELSRRFEQ